MNMLLLIAAGLSALTVLIVIVGVVLGIRRRRE